MTDMPSEYLSVVAANRITLLLGNRADAVASAVRDALREAARNDRLIRPSTLRRVESLVPANQAFKEIV